MNGKSGYWVELWSASFMFHSSCVICLTAKSRQILFSITHPPTPLLSLLFVILGFWCLWTLSPVTSWGDQRGFFLIVSLQFSYASQWNLFTTYCMINYATSPLQCSGNIKLFHSPCQIHVARRLPTQCWVSFYFSLPVGLNIIRRT